MLICVEEGCKHLMHLICLALLPSISVKPILCKAWLGTGAEGWVGNERFTSVVEDGVECSSCAHIILPRNKIKLSSGVFNIYFLKKAIKTLNVYIHVRFH